MTGAAGGGTFRSRRDLERPDSTERNLPVYPDRQSVLNHLPYRAFLPSLLGQPDFSKAWVLCIKPGGGSGCLVGGPTLRIRCSDDALLVSRADPQGLVTPIDAHFSR